MSERSQSLAAYARQFLQGRPLTDAAILNRKQLLDEGFSRLQNVLKQEFETQVDEFNNEPGTGCTLVCRFDDQPTVFRKNGETVGLTLKFDSLQRTIAIDCQEPKKFHHIIEVKLNSAETSWYYVAGHKKNELGSIGEDGVGLLVEKSLFALFGVER
jgi:hypothetical protein